MKSLDFRVEREHPIEGLRADIFERQQRLIIEAKVYHKDDVVVLGATSQAMLFRSIGNHDADVIDRIAVPLPGPPTERARRVARQCDPSDDVIWPDSTGFRQEPLE